MPRKGENIYLRKDGRWEGRYIKGRKPDGKPLFGSIYGKQYGQVKRRLVLIKSEIYQERAALSVYGNGSFHDWAEFWLEVSIRPHVRPGTYAGYRRSLDKHINPAIGRLSISRITPDHIQDTVFQLQTCLASSTLSGVCRLMKAIFEAAREKGLITFSPYQNIRVPKVRNRPPRVLSRGEQRRLEQKLLETNEIEYLLGLYTGLRVGEICALRWEDIDLENCCLYVRHSVQRVPEEYGNQKTRLVLGNPKSEHSIREIPLTRFLLDMLRERRQTEGGREDDFLFSGSNGNCGDTRTMQLRLARICDELKIQGVHMHTLRHTFATRCLENNIGHEVLREVLGHSSLQITLRHYSHCTPEQIRKRLERLELAQ